MRYFIYCRKSTDSEDRQVLSLSSQVDELRRAFPGLSVVQVLEESKSAKMPGRPIFDNMLRRVEAGEADGIISWHPDRLARNAVDGGKLIHLLDLGSLRDLKFATFTFENNSQGKFMLQIMFGYSKYYVDTLSENIRRGYRAKIALGWWPNAAPLGYLNDKNTRTIVPDPERFAVIRRLFLLARTGTYSLRALRERTIAWGLTTRPHRRVGGSTLTIGGIHRLLKNPFYAGLLPWKGNVTQGSHQPLVSLAEFEAVQRAMRRPGHEAPQRHHFPLTGLIRCGECGFMVTAEHKTNRYGRRYVYYHCSKRRLDYRCRQPSVRAEALEGMVVDHLRSVSLAAPLLAHFTSEYRHGDAVAAAEREESRRTLTRRLAKLEDWQTNLRRLTIRGRITEDEMTREEAELLKERLRLQESLAGLDSEPDWFELDTTLDSFRYQAILRYTTGTDTTKRSIVQAVGSNLTLRDQKLQIQAKRPFIGVSEHMPRSYLRRSVEEVRTLYREKDPELIATLDRVRSILKEPLLNGPGDSKPTA